jgi:hypothetical protein
MGRDKNTGFVRSSDEPRPSLLGGEVHCYFVSFFTTCTRRFSAAKRSLAFFGWVLP